MSMGLQGSDKTNVTSVETALTSAINALDPNDRASAGVRAVLNKMRTEIREVIRHERTQ